ncbi:MAG: BolA family transcriptional regulator [Myxococcales bacterium]|nr:BolA family transcriptional regulator [Myxococcales bacterium]MCB0219410.1 BolA family transcriptional regulator [Chrysiogenetes bacterium]
MTFGEIRERIERELGEGTKAHIEGMPGVTADHVQGLIVSPQFEGKTMIACHRMVMQLFNTEIASNELHAFTFKTFTPEQYEQQFQQISVPGKG